MSNAISALNGVSAAGFVTLREEGLRGMITLRADLGDKALAAALNSHCGTSVPAQRKCVQAGPITVAWMSPDELMIFCAYGDAPKLAADLRAALAGTHHLVEVVSDARAVFSLSGAAWRNVIAKLAPVDLDGFGVGDIRRTRFAQVAAAFWATGDDQVEIMCFRSVGQYMFDLLRLSSTPGSEVSYYAG